MIYKSSPCSLNMVPKSYQRAKFSRYVYRNMVSTRYSRKYIFLRFDVIYGFKRSKKDLGGEMAPTYGYGVLYGLQYIMLNISKISTK